MQQRDRIFVDGEWVALTAGGSVEIVSSHTGRRIAVAGAAGAVFTPDVERGLAVATRVRSGTLGENEGFGMNPAAPFAGMKHSDYGRDLGRERIDGYVDAQAISIAEAS